MPSIGPSELTSQLQTVWSSFIDAKCGAQRPTFETAVFATKLTTFIAPIERTKCYIFWASEYCTFKSAHITIFSESEWST